MRTTTDAMRQRDNAAAGTRWIVGYDAFDTACIEGATAAGIRWARRLTVDGADWSRALWVSANGSNLDSDCGAHVRLIYERNAHESVRRAFDCPPDEREHNVWMARRALEQLRGCSVDHTGAPS